MAEPSRTATRTPLFSRKSAIAVLGVASIAFLLVLYMSGKGGKNAPVDPACLGTAKIAARLQPLVRGEIAALTLASSSKLLPELSFTAPGGTARLADFKGRTVLFNLWATWCIPCRLEMPALDRLQEKFGGKDFAVVAVNVDTARLDRPKAFLEAIGVKNLALYSDAQGELLQALKQTGKVLGLPTTILIGRDGCELGTLAGPAQWDSQDALALLTAALG